MSWLKVIPDTAEKLRERMKRLGGMTFRLRFGQGFRLGIAVILVEKVSEQAVRLRIIAPRWIRFRPMPEKLVEEYLRDSDV